jgi:acyl-coenzyme A thioesterase PaaI-like protein
MSGSEAVQDHYPEDVAHCFGCGRLNRDGHQLKTVWEGEETISRFRPGPEHTAIPGYVYGGLLASLLDCHGTGTAALAALRREGRKLQSGAAPRFVTASLQVDYLKPTPLGPELVVRGKVVDISDRKVVVEATLSAEGAVTVRGKIVAVRMPAGMIAADEGHRLHPQGP